MVIRNPWLSEKRRRNNVKYAKQSPNRKEYMAKYLAKYFADPKNYAKAQQAYKRHVARKRMKQSKNT